MNNLDAARPISTPIGTGSAGTIEIDLANGARVRVDGFVNQRALRRVLQAMKDIL